MSSRSKKRKPKAGSIFNDIYDDEPAVGQFGDTNIYGSDIDPGAGDTA